ncbi:MAG: DUF4389 domain-containing protein [Candidatus Nanoarchaeia archaeon]
MGERGEVFMRIIVGVITGIILDVWKIFIFILGVVNWLYTLFVGRRMKQLADLSEIWNTQKYTYLRYITFVTNERPFPFTGLTKSISKFSKR